MTNKLNLPEAFVKFADDGKDHSPIDNRYSVTELLGSIKEIKLCREHYKEIERDVADCIPALFGTAVHSILEANAPESIETEVKIEVEFEGVTIVGRCDALDRKNELIEDYKTCSVSKIQKKDFEDWKLQGLIYAYLFLLKEGLVIRHLKFYAMMKDWSKIKKNYSSDYPATPIYVWEYNIDDSDYDYIHDYLVKKIALLKIKDIPDCSDEERWYTGSKYAVYKNLEDKRALIVCDSTYEAFGYLKNKLNNEGHIIERKGTFLKCDNYCDCSRWCKQKGDKNE